MPKGKGLQVDDSILRHKIRKLLKRLNIDEKEFVKEETGFLARDFTKFTPPYAEFPGTTRGVSIGKKIDKLAGELAIKGDMGRAFFLPDSDASYDWALAEFPSGFVYGKGRRIIGGGVARSISDMETHHKRLTNSRTGRISKRIPITDVLWVNSTLYQKYYEREIKNVGLSKASIAKSIKFFRPKQRIPPWISRHFGAASGNYRLDVKKSKPTGIFNASAPGLIHLRPSTIKRITSSRLKSMDQKLVKRFKHEAKLAGFGIKRKP